MRSAFLVPGFVLLLGLAVVRIVDPGPVQALRETGFDTLQRMAPRTAPQDLPLRVVDIDAAAVQALGPLPWRRDMVAGLVDRLQGYGASVVAFDMVLDGPDRLSPDALAQDMRVLGLLSPLATDALLARLDTDARLARAMAAGPVVLALGPAAEGAVPPARATFDDPDARFARALPSLSAALTPPPVLLDAAQGLGVAATDPASAPLREVPMVWRTEGGLMPGLALEALRLAQGAGTIALESSAAGPRRIVLGDLIVPVTPSGALRLHVRPADPGLSLSAAAVMAPDDDAALRARLEGPVVFVGASAQGAGAMQTTILGDSVLRATVQAQIAEQILSRRFLQSDQRTEMGEIGSFLLLGVIIVIVMGMGGPVWSALAGGTAGAALMAASWYAFSAGGLLFDVTFALAGGLVAFAVMGLLKVAVIDRERRFLRGAFASAVAPEVLAEIEKKDRAALGLGGSVRHVTAMRCNIRDFPALAETLGAVALTGLVNRLYTDLGQEIRRQRGTIDRFAGEAVTAFWNAPLDLEEHPAHAATAALNMRATVARFNAAARDGQPPVVLSIGLASGPAYVGDLGSNDRCTYTAVGEAVTAVARIESAARYVGYDIIISAETGQRIQNFARLDAGFLLLRSQTTRSGAQILVGGPELAGTQPFIDLRDSHFKLVQALRDNDADAIALRLGECRRLAAGIEPGLAGFYAVIEGRGDDYV